MAVFQCKMCGGKLNVTEGATTAECEFCGTMQTVPTADNEKKIALFERANRLRLACQFDAAMAIYESIVSEFTTEAEAYWGIVLCKYGIEYVDDPVTAKKIPTCHRSSFDSVMYDSDFEQACENADALARRLYREEAKKIEEIRKGIVEVSGKEEPYDIFICYKETAENGERTIDSVMAQEVYDELTEKGYRVFFSRISLEDKLGVEYEPYIFAALNSAKVMLVFGTEYEYFNAVWVKNEWSRFLKLIASGQKKTLIPCFKGVDAYDIPKEFARLQAQDMGKIGAMQDLVRGIEKIIPLKNETPVVRQVLQKNPTVEAYLKRANIFIEEGDFDNANVYAEKALDIDPGCAEAYVVKLLLEYKVKKLEDFVARMIQIDTNADYKRAIRFADEPLKKQLEQISTSIKNTMEEKRREEEEKIKHEKEKRKEMARINMQGTMQDRKSIAMISSGDFHTVGLNSAGTVAAVGFNSNGQCNVSDWKDIIALCAKNRRTMGLKADGTVVAVGHNFDGQCDVSDWRNIVSIAVGYNWTIGVKSDGTIVAVGGNSYLQSNVSTWKDIMVVAAGDNHAVGLKPDGTVVATGNNNDGQCNVSAWRDIMTVSAGVLHTVGLKSDGTVIATGNNNDGQCNVSAWRDIMSMYAGEYHTVGLKSDGTVVATGNNNYGQCNVSAWRDIVAVSAGGNNTVGLKSDGTVVAVGDNSYGQCEVSDWRLIQTEQEIEETMRKYKELVDAKREKLKAEKATLIDQRASLKGIFAVTKRKAIDSRLSEIEAELYQLK